MDQETHTPLASKSVSIGQNAVNFEDVPVPAGEHTFTISFKYQSPSIELTVLAHATTDVIDLQPGSSTPINFEEERYFYPDDDNDNIPNITELERGSNPIEANRAPTITMANSNFSLNENTTIVTTITAEDTDQDSLQYSISGGADHMLFVINAQTGEISFAVPPNFENPMDEGGDNTFYIDVGVSDGYLTDTLTLMITIENVVEMPDPPLLEISGSYRKLQFVWSPSNEVTTTFNLLENPDGNSGFMVAASDLLNTYYSLEKSVHLTDWINAQYLIEACSAAGCTNSSAVNIDTVMVDTIGYLKASNTQAEDLFGHSIALSGDGGTLVVGAPWEDSDADGINGDEGDDSALYAGAAYVFIRDGDLWKQQAYIKASNSGAGDQFGSSVALSHDGNTMAVGALWEDSAATGVNPPNGQMDNNAWNAGAVYVFNRIGTTWQQQAYVKASNTDSSNTTEQNDLFGHSVALSADGDTLAVGANYESSNATGVDPPNGEANNDAPHAGAVYVFARTAGDWTQQAYIKASNSGQNDEFGYSVALNEDGTTLAVGARWEASATTIINGDGSNDDAPYAGAAYVFVHNGTNWEEQAYIKAANAAAGHWFGLSLDLSDDGNHLVVSAIAEASGAIGSGAVYLYLRNGVNWTQQAFIKAFNANPNDEFGYAVSLSGDANTLVVGARYEDSSAAGVDGDQTDNSADAAGAAYIFEFSGTNWQRKSYIKASNTDADDRFGISAALNFDGTVLAVGAYQEDSDTKDFGGDSTNNNASDSGAVYLF
jgi:hypothetical protein